MRVLVSMNGRHHVEEVLEFEPISDDAVILHTEENLPDIFVSLDFRSNIKLYAETLLRNGYVDMSSDRAEYIDERVSDTTTCPDCGLNIILSQEELDLGYVICPCGAELELYDD